MQKSSNKRKGNINDFSQNKQAKVSGTTLKSNATGTPTKTSVLQSTSENNKAPVKRLGEKHDEIPSKQPKKTVLEKDGTGSTLESDRQENKMVDPLSLFAATEEGRLLLTHNV